MSDVYTEILVPKKVTAPDIFVKVILILLTGASIAAGVIVRPAFLIAAAVFLLLDILLIPRLSVEYEYLYINGELDVDKIFSKSRRKRAAVYTMEQLELMAPAGSGHLEEYERRQGIRTVNFTSRNSGAPVYVMMIVRDRQMERVLLEPDEKMLKDLKMKFPRKVFSD
ncbi:hypothetical protein DXA96_10035 [Lachnospiraceae bacterium OF09-33XD]|nr:hypothetical protein DXA96_10035 [Lachnospiraceae bacterium OF09-33XD]